MRSRLASSFVLASVLLACGGSAPEPTPARAPGPVVTPATAPAPAPAPVRPVTRAEFNRAALELAMPLFWTQDDDGDAKLQPKELAVYWGLAPGARRTDYVMGGVFTPRAQEAIARIEAQARAGGAAATGKPTTPEETKRQAALRKELGQGRVTLVGTDLAKASPAEKAFVKALEDAAMLIEVLYGKQMGTHDLAAKLPDDPASHATFWRNQGPACEGPLTQDDPACTAIPGLPKAKRSGLYPEGPLQAEGFCASLSKGDKLLADPFTAVRDEGGKLKAVPYHEAFATETKAIAAKLREASAALGTSEPALRAYLDAAAKAFGDDQWWPADEAWAKMDAKNSRFYLRVGPDEVYAEPCSTKALFHVSFGLINQGSLAWQKKLDPLKTDMENALAALAGAPYKARKVSFKLPDFVDVALNAGDSRNPFGATIGQSLPNFGPVANGGRGRTVAMTNFYKDPDSIQALEDTAKSLLCKETMALYTRSEEPQLMSTVLHEAAHNLGPAHQYKVNGKIDRDQFGGPLASTLEELKAQSAALFFTEWLADRKQITRDDADKAHVRDVVWAMGHISRGMYDAEKHPKNYSQLAAIQLGWLMREGAVTWDEKAKAANGTDAGCLQIAKDKLPAAITSLMKEVARIKGSGDKAAAEKLIAEWVDVSGAKKALHDVVTERYNRQPKASFVYDITLE